MAKSKSKSKAPAASIEELPDRKMRLRVGGPDDIYELDLDDLTLAEGEDFERIMNRPIGEIFTSNWVFSASFTVACAYIAKRRVEPQTTLEEIRALTGDDVDVLEEDRPTSTRETNGRRSGGKSRASEHGKSADSDETS